MAQEQIHIVPGEDDWLVREEGGREFGRFPTRESAEVFGRTLARMNNVDLLIYDRSGKVERRIRSFRRWFRKLLGA